MRVISAAVGAAVLAAGVVGVVTLPGDGADPATVSASPADRPEAPAEVGDDRSIEETFGDVSDYCAAVPLAQEYVVRVGADPARVDLGEMRAAFHDVRATAPEVIRDEWAMVEAFEVFVVRTHRRLALTPAERRTVAAEGVGGLRSARREAVERTGAAIVERISDADFQAAATRAVDATRDLCGLELAPRAP